MEATEKSQGNFSRLFSLWRDKRPPIKIETSRSGWFAKRDSHTTSTCRVSKLSGLGGEIRERIHRARRRVPPRHPGSQGAQTASSPSMQSSLLTRRTGPTATGGTAWRKNLPPPPPLAGKGERRCESRSGATINPASCRRSDTWRSSTRPAATSAIARPSPTTSSGSPASTATADSTSTRGTAGRSGPCPSSGRTRTRRTGSTRQHQRLESSS